MRSFILPLLLLLLLAAISTATTAAAPENDLCENATPLTTLGSVTYYGTNIGTVKDPSVPICDNTHYGPHGVWFSVIGTGSRFIASTCNDDADFDTQISVFESGCDTLECVESNDDQPDCSLFSSYVEFCTVKDKEYLIYVHGYGDWDWWYSFGKFGLWVDEMSKEDSKAHCNLNHGTCMQQCKEDFLHLIRSEICENNQGGFSNIEQCVAEYGKASVESFCAKWTCRGVFDDACRRVEAMYAETKKTLVYHVR